MSLKVVNNNKNYSHSIEFLRSIINFRLQTLLKKDDFHKNTFNLIPHKDDIIYSSLKSELDVSIEEYIIILISIIPHLSPNFFESIILDVIPNGGDLPEFGGVKGINHRGMLPTGETVQFLLAGDNIRERLEIQKYFSQEHFFSKENILYLELVREGEPLMSGRLIITQEWLDKILYGKISPPKFSIDFPAKRIETNMNWDDLVLHPQTNEQINEINYWLKFHDKLHSDENLGRKLKPGFRVLFYGPSGTGKTLTATLLGKEIQRDVYRVDLSLVISKYIGETEKNLQKVFDRAENKDWILFFDEADALFSKRTSISSSHDKYANQEVSYLLQRVEDFSGLLILASNLKSNLDDAFIRRFHSVIHFPMPNAQERYQLWQKALPTRLKLADDVNLTEVARKYEVTGANIINVIQYASLMSYSRNDGHIIFDDILNGIRKEFTKEEKSI